MGLVVKQGDVGGLLIGLYLVFESKERGILVKIAGKVVVNPVIGDLVGSFAALPEQPFFSFKLHFNSGPRAPLINPPKCGTYEIVSELTPWSAVNPANPTSEEIVTQDSTFEVTSGPNGGPCPNGALEPKLNAGLVNPVAGSNSSFVLNLSREDGTQRFSGVKVVTPKGLVARLAGVAVCPDSVISNISDAEMTGQGELDHPACPASSRVGRVLVGAGAGPYPYYPQGAEGSSGRVYLAGPYKGAPLSLVAVTPAVAGPFDLGTVVIRNAVYINPTTAQVTAVSDPIPTIIHGIKPDIRDIRLILDRNDFTRAPTNCEEMSVDAVVSGEEGGSASVSNRFQVGECASLGFKPNLSLRLFGGTKRADYQRLKAVVKPRPGDANIARTAVTLPHSVFLANEHIRTVCTRVQFAADNCPKGSIYGKARAVSPLLDNPLSGPVYLRSSDNPLPDLVVALRGPDSQPIEIDLSGRTDSKNGGIRNTFDIVPDAPVTKFTLELFGGDKSLVVNSRDLCKGVQRATVNMLGQNGRQHYFRPVVQNSCGKSKKKSGKGSKRR